MSHLVAHVTRVDGGFAARVVSAQTRCVIADALHTFTNADDALAWSRAAVAAMRVGAPLPKVARPLDVMRAVAVAVETGGTVMDWGARANVRAGMFDARSRAARAARRKKARRDEMRLSFWKFTLNTDALRAVAA
jgi:hypothetical protein